MPDHPLTFVTKKGAEISSLFDDLAALRIAVFHDYPYLYEGTVDYEKEYLRIYSNSERALLFAVYDEEKMIGATTCIPLKDETSEVIKPFGDAGFDINRIFYFGESILLPGYRGRGLGHRFFDVREAHAASFGSYHITCFCSVDRVSNHPRKPENYRSNDAFWKKRGYIQNTSIQTFMEWPDIGEHEPSAKNMIFWTRTLPSG
jgi:GNAT superfamily N-acetyltransferase